MTFPNFAGKHAHDAFFHPQDYIEYLRRKRFLPDLQMPQSIIFCYQSQLLQRIAAQEETERIEAVPNKFYLLKSTKGKVGIYGGFGIGAPAAPLFWKSSLLWGYARLSALAPLELSSRRYALAISLSVTAPFVMKAFPITTWRPRNTPLLRSG